MKKFSLLFALLFSATVFSACSSNADSSLANDESATVVPSETVTLSPLSSPSPEESERHIIGSSVYDIVLSLESTGFPEVEPQELDSMNAYTNNNTDSGTGAELSYEIYYDPMQESAVIQANFSVMNSSGADNESLLDIAAQYLGFCATMPYDKSDSDAIRDWIDDNISSVSGEGTTKTIGDAEFKLYKNTLDSGAISIVWLDIVKAVN